MITRDYWKLSHPDAPMAASYGPLASCEEWRNRRPILGREPDSYVLERVPCCHCCGADFSEVRERNGSIMQWPNGQVRCDRHHDRNPCAIEGCKRTRAAPTNDKGFPFMADDQTLCGEHWRRYVPPRSRVRRTYHAHFRRAKRQGWTMKNERAFWRFWTALVAQARRRSTEGFLDIAEIDRLLGLE